MKNDQVNNLLKEIKIESNCKKEIEISLIKETKPGVQVNKSYDFKNLTKNMEKRRQISNVHNKEN